MKHLLFLILMREEQNTEDMTKSPRATQPLVNNPQIEISKSYEIRNSRLGRYVLVGSRRGGKSTHYGREVIA